MTKTINSISFYILVLISFNACKKEPPVVTDAKPVITISNMTFMESESSTDYMIGISINGQRDNVIILNYKSKNDSAIEGEDYSNIEGSLTFAQGSSSQTKFIPIDILNDFIHEESESFEIEFNTNSLVTLTKTSSTITIEDEDILYEYEGYTTPSEYEGWTSFFADEFQGDQLNDEKWTHVIGNGCPWICGFGNNELEYYKEENTEIAEDLLTITILEEDIDDNHYTSSRIMSKHKMFFKYGRVDIRAKLPYGKGIWPAFWMMGENFDDVSWPDCGEIDIMELRGSNPSRVHGTIHYKNGNNVHQNTPEGTFNLEEEEGSFSDKFHVFSIIWNEHRVRWLIDDVEYNNAFFNQLQLGSNPNPFIEEFFFLMNVAVGGNYDGSPNSTTIFPQKMEVDYIRIFKQD